MAGNTEEIAGHSAGAGSAERQLPRLGELRNGIALRLLVLILLFSSAVTLVLTAVQGKPAADAG